MAGRNLFSDQPQPAGRNLFAPVEQTPVVEPVAHEEGYGSWLADIAKSAGSGLARGAADVVGLPGTLSDVVNSGLSYVTGLPQLPASVGSGQVVREAASAVTGGATDYKPKTTAGEYASTAAEFVPGAAAFGGISPANLVKYGILPGLTSEAGGQATEGTVLEPYARIAGALAAPFAMSAAQKIVTPFKTSPERAAQAAILKKEGVDLTAGQQTGSKGLQYRESELGGSAAGNLMERQGEQFTAAVLKRAGIDANRATPEVLDTAYKTIGKQFDDLATRNTVIPDPKLGADVGDTFRYYLDNVSPTNRIPIVENLVGDITAQVAKGPISGQWYQNMASDLAKRARETTNPELKNTLLDLRSSLDDAMERSIAVANPNDLGAFRETRNQYRNLLAITKAATGAGENAALGIISPAAIKNAAVGQGRSAYARGQGDFAELGRAGVATMSPLPNSGTAARLAARGGGTGLGAAIGAGIGGIPGAAAGAVLGPILPAAIGRAILSGPGRSYLSNQVLSETGITAPGTAAVIQSLISRGLLPSQGGQ
jgi:hypothetical protein